MALLHRLIVLMLLGAARAPPPGGGGSSDSGDSCAEDGSSATYTETIKTKSGVSVREIVSTGCPNHESYCTGKPGHSCGDEGEQTTLVEATEQSLSVEVPANPKLKNSFTAGELDCSMGTVAYALNGVGFYSGAVAFDSGGNCPQLDVADPEAEWISFDCCTGHSDYDAAYHYHFPPSCLLAQANKAAPISDGHSAQVGWAEDGFPICPRPASAHAIDATRIHRPIPRRRPARPRRRRDPQLRHLGRACDLLPGRVRRLRGRASGRRQL